PWPGAAGSESRTEFLTRSTAPLSTLPRSQWFRAEASPGSPIWATPLGVQDPARLSQKTSFSISGLLNAGHWLGVPIQAGTLPLNLACRRVFRPELLSPLATPAGAGTPLLVVADAVVVFFAMVLFTRFTTGASLRETAPPSWAETLFVIMLFERVIGDRPLVPAVPMMRSAPPSSWARLLPM